MNERAAAAIRQAIKSLKNEASGVLGNSGVSTDGLLLELLRESESAAQIFDLDGDERGRFSGPMLHENSLIVALIAQIGAREGTRNRDEVQKILSEIRRLACASSALFENLENIQSGQKRIEESENGWTISPIEDRFLGSGSYAASLVAGGRNMFQELAESNPGAAELLLKAADEVDRKTRFRVERDVTGPRDLPNLNALVEKMATLRKAAYDDELSFFASPNARLEEGSLTIADLLEVLAAVFRLLYRRRLILKRKAVMDRSVRGEGLVVVHPASRWITEVCTVSKLERSKIERSIAILSSSAAQEPSDYFLMRRPFVVLSDGALATGCHLIQTLRPTPLVLELVPGDERGRESGSMFPNALASHLRAKGARSVTSVAFDQDGIRGDIDLLVHWGKWLFVLECKAGGLFAGPRRTAHIRDELSSHDPTVTTAVTQVRKGLTFAQTGKERLARELGVPKEALDDVRLVGGIVLGGNEFDNCAVEGITIRNGPRLVRRVCSSEEMAAAFRVSAPFAANRDGVCLTVGDTRFAML